MRQSCRRNYQNESSDVHRGQENSFHIIRFPVQQNVCDHWKGEVEHERFNWVKYQWKRTAGHPANGDSERNDKQRDLLGGVSDHIGLGREERTHDGTPHSDTYAQRQFVLR